METRAINKNFALSGKEIFFDRDDIVVSKTDPTGKLTYGNRAFYKLAGLTESECIGKQHNIIRHPEMPRCVFDLLWKTVKRGDEIFAYVNNLSRNGDNYWVFAHVTPSHDADGKIVGYHSNRRVPNRDSLNKHIIPLYEKLHRIECSIPSPRESMAASSKVVEDILLEQKVNFNEYMFSLGV